MSKEVFMPFPEQRGRQYNRVNVEALKPGQMGCYGLYRSDAWGGISGSDY